MAALAIYGGGALAFAASAALYYRGKQQEAKIEGLKKATARRPQPVVAPAAPRLRILSQNVWGHMLGSGGPDTPARLTALARWIASQEVDVVLVQELFVLNAGPILEASNYLLFAEAMSKAGLVYQTGGEIYKSLVQQNHGLAIFSRFPILRSFAEPFPTSSEPINTKGYCAATIRVPGAAATTTGGDSNTNSELLVHLVNAHLDSRDHASKKRQVDFLATAIRRYLASSTSSPSAPPTVIRLASSSSEGSFSTASAASSTGAGTAGGGSTSAVKKNKRKTSSESPMDSPAAGYGGDEDHHAFGGSSGGGGDEDGIPGTEDAPLLSPHSAVAAASSSSDQVAGPSLRPSRAAAPGGSERRNSLGRQAMLNAAAAAAASASASASASTAASSVKHLTIVAGDFNICSFNERATPAWLYPHLTERMASAGVPTDLFPGPPRGADTGVPSSSARATGRGGEEEEGEEEREDGDGATPSSQASFPVSSVLSSSSSSSSASVDPDSATIPTAYSKKKGFRALDHAFLSPEAKRRVVPGSRRVVSLFNDGHWFCDGTSEYRRAPPVSDHRGLVFDLALALDLDAALSGPSTGSSTTVAEAGDEHL